MTSRERTTTIVIHGAWTPASLDVGAAEIREWHLQRGFDDIGYHYVIRRDGTVESGRPKDAVGAHARGYNSRSIGICLVGGRDLQYKPGASRLLLVEQELAWEFNYTMEQMVALDELLAQLLQDYPQVDRIVGHRDFPDVKKRCPGFDVRSVIGTPQAVLDRVYHGE